jgi:hypothetical protein
MSQFRYPGAKPFVKEEQHLFFGREDDIKQLYSLVALESLIVLFGKSGLGKSSLINAGMASLFKSKNYSTIFIRFGNKPSENADTLHDIFIQRTTNNPKKNFLDKIIDNNHSFWYIFKSKQIEDKLNQQYLIIFDQFEEIFTFSDEVESFTNSVAELLSTNIPEEYRVALRDKIKQGDNILSDEEIDKLYKPLNIKILISIRSDKLSFLNRLSYRIPNILQKCYELLPLTPAQAINAIAKPAQLNGDFYSPKFNFSSALLNYIIDYLSGEKLNSIESFQLQLICQYFENQAIELRKKTKHTAIEFDAGENVRIVVKQISEHFYNNIISSFPAEVQRKICLLIEEGLILEEERRRISLYKGQIIKRFEITEELLNQLVDKRIIRSENNTSNLPYYELSHDTLIEPILLAKKKRTEAEAQERLLKELEEKRRIDAQINTLQKARDLKTIDTTLFRINKSETLKRQQKLFFTQAKLRISKQAIKNSRVGIFILLFLISAIIWSVVATYKIYNKQHLINQKATQIQQLNLEFRNYVNAYDSTLNPEEYKRLKNLYDQYKNLQR